jgi:hypothetical protein
MKTSKIKEKRTNEKKIKEMKTKIKPKKHIYYIHDCYVKDYAIFGDKYLRKHLNKLGMKQDKSMKTIKKRDIKGFKKAKKPIATICDPIPSNKHFFYKIPKDMVKADVFFLHIHKFFFNNRFYKYPKYFCNLLNVEYLDSIINKYIMNENLVKINPNVYSEYLLENFLIDELDKYHFPGLYILRPISDFKGRNIHYVSTLEQVKESIKFFKHTRNLGQKAYGNQVVSTRYITNPLLFSDRKFHIRLYLLTALLDNKYYAFLADFGKIFTSDKPFNLELPFDKDIHDTHGESSKELYFYPNDFTNEYITPRISKANFKKINQKIKSLTIDLAKLIGQDKSKLLYPEAKNGYYFYGMDIMITEEMKPILIEINTKPGLSNPDKSKFDVHKRMYDWINRIVLEPFFLHKNPDLAKKDPTFIYSA